ncbi:hypothetical protein TruAng_001436 [Truncatella angustata]|nr:hypothetical protein TruAng_001436 [Truncatella angustata]
MWKGYSGALGVVSLPDIDAKLLSEQLWERIGPQLEKSENEGHSFLLTVFWALKAPLLAPIFPYLILIASQLAQPFLISTILNYVGSDYDGSNEQRNTGYGLIGAYGLVYLSIAVACAMYILYRQVGVVFIAPIILSIAITSSLLGSIKGVKMLGWSRKASELIQQLRLAEIASARRFRLMLLAVVTTSFIPVTLAPVATFGIFAARSQTGVDSALGSTRIFTTLSLLSLITQPLDLLFAYIPEILAAVACFSRIQNYLYQDKLLNTSGHHKSSAIKPSSSGVKSTGSSTVSESDERDEKTIAPKVAIKLEGATFGWGQQADSVLQSVNLTFGTGKLTMITGPIASGKSTLLKGILRETPICEGVVQLSSHSIAFCDQNPWLANETLRNNILGTGHFNASWYGQVIRACALEEDIARFSEGDQIIVGSNGLSLSGGQKQRVAIARAVYSKRSIALFDDVFSGLDMETQAHIIRDVFGTEGLLKAMNTTVVFVTHAAHLLDYADYIVVLDVKGQVVKEGPPEKVINEDMVLSEIEDASAADGQDSMESAGKEHSSSEPANPEPSTSQNSVDVETQRLGDRAVYKYYFSTFGWPKTIVFFALQIVLVFCLKFPEIILSWWGESNDKDPQVENSKWLGIFAALEAGALIALVLVCWHVLLNLAVISGSKLHHTLLKCTLRAPLSFFGVTDIGSITNRFSQDMNLVDAELPFSLINFVTNGLTCLAQAFMIIPASAWLLIGYPVLFGVLWLLQRFYLRTSRQLRFLDLDAKSPIYAQFLETLSGLATIRAFGWQEDFTLKADKRLDYSQKPFYLLYSIQRWLNLVLDLIVACLAVILIAIAVALRNSTSVGFAGVALFNIMNLSAALKSAITSWTTLETSIGAVARVKRYEESTPDENLIDEDQEPPQMWPTSGTIIFDNVTASYKDDSDRNAITNMSIQIKDGEKIGICGRSGSGKSSTLLALLHLINPNGAIIVDGLDILRIPRETLRERLTAVPQDPVFLAGTVRLNCDPYSNSSDESITEALRTVHLWDVVEARGGLDTDLNDDFFSKGQQQLFSLARALLNHGKIIVMDEASSSLDAESERLMMSIVKSKFKNATVLSVAHRLDTITDFDRVIVLDSGKIIEGGPPKDLLARPSVFRALYESSLHVSEKKA